MKLSIRDFIKTEPIVLSCIIIIVICLSGFMFLANVITSDQYFSFDEQILLSFRNHTNLTDPVGPDFLEYAMTDLSSLGSFSVILVVFFALMGFLVLKRQYRLCFFVLFSILGGAWLVVLLKSFYMRPRPELVTYLTSAQFSSFPSGHSMSAAVVYLTLAALLTETVKQKHLKIYILCWAILIVFIVGVSRVYIGVHWPSDVLAGWMAGASWALFCWIIQRSVKGSLRKGI